MHLEKIRWSLFNLIEQIVDEPNKIKVDLIRNDQTNVLRITVDKSDVGKIIGKSGKNIMALRTLIQCFSAKHKLKLHVEVIE